jgi:protoporphyrinogen IX oxidase
MRAAVSLGIVAVVCALLVVVTPPAWALWIKALHVVAVISWMAGMLYLPRLFVYHCGVAAGSEASETFKVMERKLLRAIINPAMVVAWIAGLWLAWTSFRFQGGWLHAKLAFVFALSGLHGYYSAAVRTFAEDRNLKSARFWRVMNEAPAVIMVIVVILVVVKPF